jgi:hypothetical protein
MSSYQLVNNWASLVEDVRERRIVSQIPSVVWNAGTKHGLEEGSVSRDIVSFISRRVNRIATNEEVASAFPTTFDSPNKIPNEFAKEFLRELVKMGILIKIN